MCCALGAWGCHLLVTESVIPLNAVTERNEILLVVLSTTCSQEILLFSRIEHNHIFIMYIMTVSNWHLLYT